MLTIDGNLDDSRVCAKVVVTLYSVRSVVQTVGVLDRQDGVSLTNLDLELVIVLQLFVVAHPDHVRLREPSEWNLEDDVLALLEESSVQETRRHVDLRRTCGSIH